jgi:hypothetical protein
MSSRTPCTARCTRRCNQHNGAATARVDRAKHRLVGRRHDAGNQRWDLRTIGVQPIAQLNPYPSCPEEAKAAIAANRNVRPPTSRKVTRNAASAKRKPESVPGARSTRRPAAQRKSPAAAKAVHVARRANRPSLVLVRDLVRGRARRGRARCGRFTPGLRRIVLPPSTSRAWGRDLAFAASS